MMDHETLPTIVFHVRVTDLGKPHLSSESLAKVVISINDVNDCSPTFSQSTFNTSILTPTYPNIAVLQVNYHLCISSFRSIVLFFTLIQQLIQLVYIDINMYDLSSFLRF